MVSSLSLLFSCCPAYLADGKAKQMARPDVEHASLAFLFLLFLFPVRLSPLFPLRHARALCLSFSLFFNLNY